MEKINIKIKEQKYINIYISRLEKLADVIRKEDIFFSKLLLITHKNLWNLYKEKLITLKPEVLFLEEGEKIKSFYYYKFLISKFINLKLDRKSLVLIFGGGVLGDLVGFVCSTYMRGINYIQIPTTLLAMIDSSVGGKTAINFKQKNIVGSFYQPKLIFLDINLLNSLPKEEIYNGLGEVLKYALINKKIFNLLYLKKQNIYNTNILKNLILECVKTKLAIVKKDEKELFNIREKLNLGHTIAHAIESATQYKFYSHGECVILGLIAESFISNKLKILSNHNFLKIIDLINEFTRNKVFTKNILKIKNHKIFEFIKYDKKFYNKNFRFVLPQAIGKVKILQNIPKNFIFESLDYVKKWINQR